MASLCVESYKINLNLLFFNINMRKANITDAQTLMDMDRKIFGIHYNLDLYEDILEQGVSLIWDVDQKPVGYILVDLQKSIYIYSLAVLKKFRNLNIAQNLLQAILIHEKPIKLTVRPSNKVAIHIYEKLGFTVYDEVEKYYHDGESCIKMIRK
jgi:[ribosomal protein S18]-alanine N-acetyltransferase